MIIAIVLDLQVPEDETPEDGTLGAHYVAELAGDETADDGIINFDDLLAHDGRDLTAALTQRPSQSPFARARPVGVGSGGNAPLLRSLSVPDTVARRLSAEFTGATHAGHAALRSTQSMIDGDVVEVRSPHGTLRRTTIDFKLTYECLRVLCIAGACAL